MCRHLRADLPPFLRLNSDFTVLLERLSKTGTPFPPPVADGTGVPRRDAASGEQAGNLGKLQNHRGRPRSRSVSQNYYGMVVGATHVGLETSRLCVSKDNNKQTTRTAPQTSHKLWELRASVHDGLSFIRHRESVPLPLLPPQTWMQLLKGAEPKLLQMFCWS